MDDYGGIYADWAIFVVCSQYQRLEVGIVAGRGIVADRVGVETEPVGNGTDGGPDGLAGAPVQPVPLPSGFRRLGDLRKRAAKQSYGDLTGWIGKTIRLDGVNFQTEQRDGKTVIVSGEMTFSEFDPTNPEREVSKEMVTKTAIPRAAIRALYAGLQANPDETIVCDVVKGKRGIALQ
jgi:hypothetical protein